MGSDATDEDGRGVRLDEGKATSSSAARRATRRFGCQPGWLRSNFFAARLDETEYQRPIAQEFGDVGLGGQSNVASN